MDTLSYALHDYYINSLAAFTGEFARWQAFDRKERVNSIRCLLSPARALGFLITHERKRFCHGAVFSNYVFLLRCPLTLYTPVYACLNRVANTTLPIMLCTIKENRESKLRFVFSIISPTNTIMLQAADTKDLETWSHLSLPPVHAHFASFTRLLLLNPSSLLHWLFLYHRRLSVIQNAVSHELNQQRGSLPIVWIRFHTYIPLALNRRS